MKFKCTEITMRLMLGLKCVVNGSPHVKPVDWLALAREGISFTKDPLDQVEYPLEYFHSAILLYSYLK